MTDSTGGDPRDGPRHGYSGDDHVNPALRSNVNHFVNKANRLSVMENPENRAAIIKRLAVDLPPYELAEVIGTLLLGWKAQLRFLPFFTELVVSDDAWEALYKARTAELAHKFVATVSRKRAGKKLNRCTVCKMAKNWPLHVQA